MGKVIFATDMHCHHVHKGIVTVRRSGEEFGSRWKETMGVVCESLNDERGRTYELADGGVLEFGPESEDAGRS